ncbi:MAG: hypothetical protein ACOYEN_06645 [Limnochordia bacterium]|jgi:type II secretory pathway component GspD/PulD (secretin)|nr:hypothetical protein [Limnochordia bacterium]
MKKRTCILSVAFVIFVSSIAWGATSLNMKFESADLLDVFQALGEIGGFNIIADESVHGTVSLSLKELEVMEAVDLIARTKGLAYRMVYNTLVVATPSRIESDFAVEKLMNLPLTHIQPDMAIEAFKSLGINVQVFPDYIGNSLILKAEQPVLLSIEEILQRIDQPRTLEYEWEDEPIFKVFQTLAKEAGLSLIMDPSVDAKVTMYLTGREPVDGIALVAQKMGLDYRIEGEILFVYPKDTGSSVTTAEAIKIFQMSFMKASQFKPFMEVLAPRLAAVFNDELNVLLVRGPENEIERLGQFIGQYDRPQLIINGIVESTSQNIAIANVAGKNTLLWQGIRLGTYEVTEVTSNYVEICNGQNCLRYGVWGSSFQ